MVAADAVAAAGAVPWPVGVCGGCERVEKQDKPDRAQPLPASSFFDRNLPHLPQAQNTILFFFLLNHSLFFLLCLIGFSRPPVV